MLTSFLVTWAIGLPFETHPLRTLPTDLVFVSVYVLLYGYAAYFAWRAVGAGPSIEPVFTIHFYLAGVLKLMLTATIVTAIGVLRFGDAASYDELVHAMTSDGSRAFALASTLPQRPSGRLAAFVTIAGGAMMLAWIVIGWGAYRSLMGVGRLRSMAALTLFLAFCVPIQLVVTVVATALIR